MKRGEIHSVSYFDGGNNEKIFEGNQYTDHLIAFMAAEEIWGNKKFVVYPEPHFIQEDSFNCGLLCCIMMDFLVHNEAMPYAEIPAHILKKLRVKLAYVIHFSPWNEMKEHDNQNQAAELQVAIESDEVKRCLFALLDKVGDKAVAEEAAV